MAEHLKIYMENPLLAALALLGIIVTIILFVLFYRNRKQDIRRGGVFCFRPF
jgi:hypothetical protein